MKFMVMVKATKNSEAGIMPGQELIAKMMKFNEELVKAGVLLGGEGLHPSSRGVRVKFAANDARTTKDGPFAETKELVSGFWILQTKTKEEVVEWIRRCPHPMPGEETEIEIRQILSPEDFGEGLTPDLQKREEELRKKTSGST